jgi:hypothetical protein
MKRHPQNLRLPRRQPDLRPNEREVLARSAAWVRSDERLECDYCRNVQFRRQRVTGPRPVLRLPIRFGHLCDRLRVALSGRVGRRKICDGFGASRLQHGLFVSRNRGSRYPDVSIDTANSMNTRSFTADDRGTAQSSSR